MKTQFSQNLPILVLAGLTVWLSLDFVVLWKYAYISTGDNGDIILPGLSANESLGYGASYWDVFGSGGTDRMAQGYFGLIDVWLFDTLPMWVAYQIRAVSQIIAALIGTYLISRKALGFGPWAGLIAGFFYAGVAMPGQLFLSTMSYLPLSIWALSKVFAGPGRLGSWTVLGLTGLLISYTAYLSRLEPFVFFVQALWFVFIDPRRRVREWAVIIAFNVLLVGLRLPDYLAMASFAPLSNRLAYMNEESFSSLFQGLVSYLAPFKLLPFLLFLFGLANWRSNGPARRVGYALVCGVAVAVLGLVVKFAASDFIPLLKGFGVGRTTQYLWLFFSLGAGAGFASVERVSRMAAPRTSGVPARLRRSAPTILLSLAFLASMTGKYASAKDWITQGSYVRIFESPVLKELARDIRGSGRIARAVTIQFYSTFLHPYGIETVGGYNPLATNRYDRFWRKIIEPSKATPYRSRMMLLPDVHRTDWDLVREYNFNLLSLANGRYFVSRDRLQAPSLKLLHKSSAPWSALTTWKKVMRVGRENFTGLKDIYIYENTDAFERFFLIEKLRTLPGDGAVLDAVAGADLGTLRRTGFIRAGDLPRGISAEKGYSGAGTILVKSYAAGPDNTGRFAAGRTSPGGDERLYARLARVYRRRARKDFPRRSRVLGRPLACWRETDRVQL